MVIFRDMVIKHNRSYGYLYYKCEGVQLKYMCYLKLQGNIFVTWNVLLIFMSIVNTCIMFEVTNILPCNFM